MEKASDPLDELKTSIDELGEESLTVVDRAEALLVKIEALFDQFNETVYRDRMYREGLQALMWLVGHPGYIKKTDLRNILHQIDDKATASLRRELKKLVPDWIPPDEARALLPDDSDATEHSTSAVVSEGDVQC